MLRVSKCGASPRYRRSVPKRPVSHIPRTGEPGAHRLPGLRAPPDESASPPYCVRCPPHALPATTQNLRSDADGG